MPIENYAISTARNAKDIAQYLAYPFFKAAAMVAFKGNSYKANMVAGIATTAFYTGINYTFFGLESDGFNENVRKAVAAEMGRKPEELKFSDFFDSKNCIVKRRMEIFNLENTYRYPVGLLPMLPTVMEHVGRKIKGPPPPGEYEVRKRIPDDHAPALDHILGGWNLWDHAVYGGVAAAWVGETYFIDKSAAYEAEKIAENDKSVARKTNENHWIGLYNRMRHDVGQEMIRDKVDREKIWPVLTELSKQFNESPNIDIPETIYLFGMGKLDIFKRDANNKEIRDAEGHLVVDPEAYKRAFEEIDRVKRIGLSGIGEENRLKNEALKAEGKAKEAHKPGFVARLNRNALDAQFNSFQKLFGHQHSSEHISSRDFGDTPLSMS